MRRVLTGAWIFWDLSNKDIFFKKPSAYSKQVINNEVQSDPGSVEKSLFNWYGNHCKQFTGRAIVII